MATNDREDVETLMRAAKTAVVNKDYDTAENNAVAALALVGGLPNMTDQRGEIGGMMQWTHEAIAEFLKQVQRLQSKQIKSANKGGISTLDLHYPRVDCEGT